MSVWKAIIVGQIVVNLAVLVIIFSVTLVTFVRLPSLLAVRRMTIVGCTKSTPAETSQLLQAYKES